MTCDDDLLAHLGIHISGGGQLELGMGVITLFTYGTEASEIVDT